MRNCLHKFVASRTTAFSALYVVATKLVTGARFCQRRICWTALVGKKQQKKRAPVSGATRESGLRTPASRELAATPPSAMASDTLLLDADLEGVYVELRVCTVRLAGSLPEVPDVVDALDV